DELRDVLDRIDVVVRRRRDQADPGGRVANLGDVLVHLVTGQLPAFSRLGALRDLDLQLVGVDEVIAGHAETAGGDLVDGAAAQVSVLVPDVTDGILPALARVRLAADAVHGDREVFVRLATDRPERHRSGLEALDDLDRRLDFLEGNGNAGLQLQEPPER